jgi:hypothetical protein
VKNPRHFLAGNSIWDHPDMIKTGMLKGVGIGKGGEMTKHNCHVSC